MVWVLRYYSYREAGACLALVTKQNIALLLLLLCHYYYVIYDGANGCCSPKVVFRGRTIGHCEWRNEMLIVTIHVLHEFSAHPVVEIGFHHEPKHPQNIIETLWPCSFAEHWRSYFIRYVGGVYPQAARDNVGTYS